MLLKYEYHPDDTHIDVHCTSPWTELLVSTSHVPDQLLRLKLAGLTTYGWWKG
jgi:hypothetical protein